MHGTAPRLRVLRSRLRPVDRQLGALELVAFLHDRTRLVELAAELVRTRICPGGSGMTAATEEPEQRKKTYGPRPRTAHGPMLHCRRFLPRYRAVLPERRSQTRPIQTTGREVSGNAIAYEILLMLDPGLPGGRDEEIVKRAVDPVKKAGGKRVGRARLGRLRPRGDVAHHRGSCLSVLT